MIRLESVYKTVKDGSSDKCILSSLNLQIDAGQSVSITGASGSGKSTLLHLMAALDSADSGTIEIDSQRLDGFTVKQADAFRKTHIGLIFQQFNLIDSLTVWDNIAFPARLNACYDPQRLAELCDILGLSAHKHKYVFQLSGGEQQRVAIARALSHRPKVILADEPTGNLDEDNSLKVANLLFSAAQQFDTTMVLVTHSQSLAALADRHLALSNGRLVVQDGLD